MIELLDNKDVIEKIHNFAEIELRRVLDSYSESYVSDQETIFISLVLIAMLYYDGNYYENVRTTYKKLYEKYREQKIEGLIRMILKRYCSKEEEKNKGSRIINVALSNAIVPSHFLKSFFEFIYDIYKLNFEYTLSDDLYEDFQFVYDGLRSNMFSSDDQVQVNVTKKSYKLIQSTKQLIVNQKYMDAVIKLSIIIVNLIDKRIWDKEIQIFNPYLKQGFEKWNDTLREDKDVIRYRRKAEFRSQWEPKYILQDNQIYIVPPIHRIKAQYHYWDIRVVVENHNQEIYVNREPDVREIIGGYQIRIHKFRVENPLGNLTYRFFVGEEIIYDSKEKLCRTVIVFDQDGNEIQNNTDYSGIAVFCTDGISSKLKPFYKTTHYILTERRIQLGETCIIGETIFHFSSFVKPEILGEEWENHYIVLSGKEEQIPIYKQIKFLVFEIEDKISWFQIILDGKHKKLEDFQYSLLSREGIHQYRIYLDAIQNGIHTIEVYSLREGRKNKILFNYFALDSELYVESEKIDCETYLVLVESALLSTPIIQELKVREFHEDWLKFSIRGIEYLFYIPYAFDLYRISAGSWMPFEEEIWIGDITQDTVLEIYGYGVDELRVLSCTDNTLETDIKLIRKGVIQQVNIRFLISYKVTYDYTKLLFLKDGKARKTIYCYNKCVLDEDGTELIYDPILKYLDVFPKFFGKGNVYFKVTDSIGEEIYKSRYLKKGEIESVSGLVSFQNYKITFYEKEKGLSLKREHLLKEYERMFYAREDFVGHSFKIKEVTFDQFVDGEFLRKKYCFHHIYLCFLKEISNDTYSGKLYKKTCNEVFMLNKINPVDIEICSDGINGTIELAITKDGDGLLLDFEHHGIRNTLDDKLAVDIFSYTIDMNGEELV